LRLAAFTRVSPEPLTPARLDAARGEPLPANVLPGLLKFSRPVKVWLPFSLATLLLRRTSEIVPVRFAAFW
jgi:hypothetical protein